MTLAKRLHLKSRLVLEEGIMLARVVLLTVVLVLGINSYAQSYGLLQNNLSRSNQEQLGIMARGLEDGLGRALTIEELNELKETLLEAGLENSNLVRISKRDTSWKNTLFCLWGAISPIAGSFATGTCVDISGNSYGIVMTTIGPMVGGFGPFLGAVGRYSVLFYKGIKNLPVEGTYKTGVISEFSVALGGGHFGHFENWPGSKEIIFVGGTASVIFAAGFSISMENDIYLGLQITKLNK